MAKSFQAVFALGFEILLLFLNKTEYYKLTAVDCISCIFNKIPRFYFLGEKKKNQPKRIESPN